MYKFCRLHNASICFKIKIVFSSNSSSKTNTPGKALYLRPTEHTRDMAAYTGRGTRVLQPQSSQRQKSCPTQTCGSTTLASSLCHPQASSPLPQHWDRPLPSSPLLPGPPDMPPNPDASWEVGQWLPETVPASALPTVPGAKQPISVYFLALETLGRQRSTPEAKNLTPG